MSADKIPASPWPTELIAQNKHESPADVIKEHTTPKTLQRPRRLTWAELKVALESGWRAGLKQYRKRGTELRRNESQQAAKSAKKEQP